MSQPREDNPTKTLLITAGGFLAGFLVFVLLHNVFAGLAGLSSDVVILGSLLNALSVACFLIALFVCPIGFVACLVAVPVERLTRGWNRGARLGLLLLLPAAAAVGGLGWFENLRAISVIERDEAAGFNGSFETVRSGYPANWYFYKEPIEDGDADISLDAGQPVDGARSLKLVVRRAEAGDGRRNPGLFQTIDAEPARTYSISFWLRTDGGRVGLRIASERPESMADQPIEVTIDADNAIADTWRQFTYSYTVPPEYSNIRFELNVLSPGTLWIDDVRIAPAAD